MDDWFRFLMEATAPYPRDTRAFIFGSNVTTAHPHLVLRSRIYGCLFSVLFHAFMLWCLDKGTDLLLNFLFTFIDSVVDDAV